MNVTLTNDVLSVVISTHGAELQSIVNIRTGEQYLWQGDSAFWGRRSPVLFPIVGSVWNGEYRMDGNVYRLGQHGFARDMEFAVVDSAEENEAWFTLVSDDSTMKLYPRSFRLDIGYALVGERIEVMWRVHNTDTKEMVFQIGAHPAFNYPDFNASDPVHGYFCLGETGPLQTQLVAEKGCIGDETADIALDAEGMLPITATTFECDALVIGDSKVHRVSLLSKKREPYVTLFFDAPLVGLWSKSAAAPFVCIEPWWGRADRVGFCGEFAERQHVNSLAPGETFSASYLILIDNL